MDESAEYAVVREIEEVGVASKIICPLWQERVFFKEDVDSLNHHELCSCVLMDISEFGDPLWLKENMFICLNGWKEFGDTLWH